VKVPGPTRRILPLRDDRQNSSTPTGYVLCPLYVDSGRPLCARIGHWRMAKLGVRIPAR
jgi:hypothetical protein